MFILTHHNQTDQVLYFGICSFIECLASIIQLKAGALTVCLSPKHLLFYNKKKFCVNLSVHVLLGKVLPLI